jgi:hypothetical protein
MRVVANLMEGSVATIAYVGGVDCQVTNNTIINPHHWILRILQETTTSLPYEFEPCRDGLFANNLIWFEWADLRTWINIGPNTAIKWLTNTTLRSRRTWQLRAMPCRVMPKRCDFPPEAYSRMSMPIQDTSLRGCAKRFTSPISVIMVRANRFLMRL